MAATVHDTSFFSRRILVLIAIVALHIGVVIMLATGLARKVVEIIAPPIETKLIEEVQPHDVPPPPPPPEFERPPIEVPPPDVTIEIPVETPTAITNVTDKPVPKSPPAPPSPRAVIKANGKFPSTDDFYPPASIRLEEQGAVTIKYCVGPNGKLAETPTVVGSSRSARLDEAAVRLAKAARYTAGSIDGVLTTDCNSIRVKFELKK